MLNRSKIVIAVDLFIFIRAQDIPHSSDAAELHAVPKSRLGDRDNYQQPTSPTLHTAPHRFQMVTFGMVSPLAIQRPRCVFEFSPWPQRDH
jgi:hypothetical protein